MYKINRRSESQVRGQLAGLCSLPPPWDLGTELRLSGLHICVASITCRTISLDLKYYFYLAYKVVVYVFFYILSVGYTPQTSSFLLSSHPLHHFNLTIPVFPHLAFIPYEYWLLFLNIL